ncbi:hypothetical protein [Pseudobacteroides cellulosolvens]|uniref:Uncharacterized protein n=1 Tax=Pseudobacteroides cellulosolvens ATCC 35603 = DSM 2933 TaxID=398512 RepID=A0A0L6JLT4_9FIRM|nr:hypothetical protein [Pseudobacteroides cellulosolvens]KNY26362.1 hypothetical protein Bccel_1624 [Pseudobacteroides cellulosolvens ATCC 35603 = DSM 2933]
MSKYADNLAEAIIDIDNNDKAKAERLIIKATGETEIRFSWWTQGGTHFQHAPLDMSEDNWLCLFEAAFENKVFSDEFIKGLKKMIQKYNNHF